MFVFEVILCGGSRNSKLRKKKCGCDSILEYLLKDYQHVTANVKQG